MTTNNVWMMIGFLGQFFFTMRFLTQWIYSEIKKQSIIPVSFWFFSILGSIMLLSYAIYRKDPVFIIGQMFGSIVYIRNLILIKRKKEIRFRTFFQNINKPE